MQEFTIQNLNCIPPAICVGSHISRGENSAKVVAGTNQKICQALCRTRGGVAFPFVHMMTGVACNGRSFQCAECDREQENDLQVEQAHGVAGFLKRVNVP